MAAYYYPYDFHPTLQNSLKLIILERNCAVITDTNIEIRRVYICLTTNSTWQFQTSQKQQKQQQIIDNDEMDLAYISFDIFSVFELTAGLTARDVKKLQAISNKYEDGSLWVGFC